METIRFIKQSNESGTIEFVRFIDDQDDFSEPASYFIEDGCTIDWDDYIDYAPWMEGFPMNYSLKRQ